tara:strand:+ start:3303 stop:3545 length:243 start_codon:yes stop_codon:yes gene_type:complete
MSDLVLEALVVGIMTVIFGTMSGALVGSFFKMSLPKICSDWNKFYIMEITLFITGVLIHLFCEYTMINKWYCKNGYACLN